MPEKQSEEAATRGPGARERRVRGMRDGLAIAITLVFCLAAGARSVIQFASGRSTIPADTAEIAAIGERFEAIAAALPATGAVGYFSDRPVSELLGAREFMLAQHFLAPRVLEYRGVQPVAVGRFETESALREFLDGSDYEVTGGGPAPRPVVLERGDAGGPE